MSSSSRLYATSSSVDVELRVMAAALETMPTAENEMRGVVFAMVMGMGIFASVCVCADDAMLNSNPKYRNRRQTEVGHPSTDGRGTVDDGHRLNHLSLDIARRRP